jgi:phosphatidylethanolamine-binding protein (PEBP) family uncharacterized protein
MPAPTKEQTKAAHAALAEANAAYDRFLAALPSASPSEHAALSEDEEDALAEDGVCAHLPVDDGTGNRLVPVAWLDAPDEDGWYAVWVYDEDGNERQAYTIEDTARLYYW